MTRFRWISDRLSMDRILKFINIGYAVVGYYQFKGIRLKNKREPIPYLNLARLACVDFKLDNGRILEADYLEVALLQRKLGTLRPQFVITIPGLPEITVVRELVFLRVQYSVHILDWTVEGDVFHHDFYIRSGVKEIARIRKKWVANADQYSVEVLDDRDDLPVLLIVLAIDCSLLEARMATKISGAEK